MGERLFAGPGENDTVMTTWHATDTLDEALEYFLAFTCPTDGFIPESDFWLAVCIDKPAWAATIGHNLESLP